MRNTIEAARLFGGRVTHAMELKSGRQPAVFDKALCGARSSRDAPWFLSDGRVTCRTCTSVLAMYPRAHSQDFTAAHPNTSAEWRAAYEARVAAAKQLLARNKK